MIPFLTVIGARHDPPQVTEKSRRSIASRALFLVADQLLSIIRLDGQPSVRVLRELLFEQKRGFAIQGSHPGNDAPDEFDQPTATLGEFGNRQTMRIQMHLEHLAWRGGVVGIGRIGGLSLFSILSGSRSLP